MQSEMKEKLFPGLRFPVKFVPHKTYGDVPVLGYAKVFDALESLVERYEKAQRPQRDGIMESCYVAAYFFLEIAEVMRNAAPKVSESYKGLMSSALLVTMNVAETMAFGSIPQSELPKTEG